LRNTIVNGLKNWVAGSAALSDELANVQKATGKSADEVKRLNQELGNINTRTANADLREIAILAVARATGSVYEWTQHVVIGRACGMTEAQIEALAKALDTFRLDTGHYPSSAQGLTALRARPAGRASGAAARAWQAWAAVARAPTCTH
jgi:alkylhydroperoxidase family enzyme